MTSTVLIAPASRRSILHAVRLAGMPLRWAYLGETLPKALACAACLDGKAELLPLGLVLQDIARTYRNDFVEYIGSLSRRHQSDVWWLGSLSEKNPYVSKVFLRTCYIRVAEEIANDQDERVAILFVAEDRVVRECLDQYFRGKAVRRLHRFEVPGAKLRDQLNEIIQFGLRRAWFVVKHLGRIAITRAMVARWPVKSNTAEQESGITLAHSWVDGRSFNKDGTYCSINFGKLEQHMAERGRRYAIMPHILSTLPFRKGVRKMLRSGVPFLFSYSYLKPRDVFQIACEGFARPASATWPFFQGVDIAALILDDQRQDWVRARRPNTALVAAAVRRLAESGLSIERFIYSFENHVWEKACCLAFRKHLPKAELIGYQDANLPPMALNFFIAASERDLVPLPDLVITNGWHGYETLKHSGYDTSRLRRGGAIRYQYLAEAVHERERIDTCNGARHGKGLPTILVTPSISESLALELIWKTLRAFNVQDQVRVLLKCHPALPYRMLAKGLNIVDLPAYFEVSVQPVQVLLQACSLLLYMDSTTSLEALAAGVPVIHVGPDFGLDCDPLDGYSEIRSSVQSPRELHDTVLAMLGSDAASNKERARKGRELVSQFFGRADESAYRCFLDLPSGS